LLSHLNLLIPSSNELGGLTAVLAVAVLLIGLGAFAGGPTRRPEGDLVFGLGIAVAAFTLAASIGVTHFTAVAAALGLGACAGATVVFRRNGRLTDPGVVRIALVALPLIAIAASMLPTQWDEFSHWLAHARYLFEHDSVPRSDLPRSFAVFPAYPYGNSLVAFMASRVTGAFVINASTIFSVLLLLSFGLLISRIIVSTASRTSDGAGPTNDTLNATRAGWAVCALGALAATILNPTYVTRLVFSAYADAPTGVLVGFAAALVWLSTNALAIDNEDEARSLAWQAGLVSMAMIGLKQVNIVFLMALGLALSILVLRDPAIRWKATARLAARIFLLPLIVYLLWKLHVAFHITEGDFEFLPYSEWLIREIPQIIARMALIASKKGGYFGVMTIAVVAGVLAIWRYRGAFSRLAIITGTMFLSYNFFLLFAYVTAFGSGEALYAASYWRYNTHLGGVCLLFAAFSAALLWRRYLPGRMPSWAHMAAIVLVIALPVGMAKKLRFDTHPRYQYAWETGRALADRLAAGDRILLVDASDNGQYLIIMRYHLLPVTALVDRVTSWNRLTPESVRKRIEDKQISHIWLYDFTPSLKQALGVDLKASRSWLLRKDSGKWVPEESWPHPAE